MKFAGAAFQRQNILLAQFKEMPVPPPYVCLRTCCSSYCTRVLIALYSCCCKIISNIIFLFTIAYYFVSLKQGTTISLLLKIVGECEGQSPCHFLKCFHLVTCERLRSNSVFRTSCALPVNHQDRIVSTEFIGNRH